MCSLSYQNHASVEGREEAEVRHNQPGASLRQEASRLFCWGKLIPEAAAALDEQLKTFEGLSGAKFEGL